MGGAQKGRGDVRTAVRGEIAITFKSRGKGLARRSLSPGENGESEKREKEEIV